MSTKTPKTAPTSTTPKGMIALGRVPLDSIRVVEGWNARSVFDDAKLRELADGMADVGQLQPIVLAAIPEAGEGGGFKWDLVAGERRVRAARMLGWADLDACRLPDDADRARAMRGENVDRVELTHAERARYFQRQLDGKLATADTLAASFRISVQAVRNDANIARKLAPEVWEEWSKYPLASKIALQIYAMPHEKQVEAFKTWKEARDAEDAETAARGGKKRRGKGKEKNGPNENRRPIGEVRATIGEMVDLREQGKRATGKAALDKEVVAFVEGAEWALAFLMGERGIPRDEMADLKSAAKAAGPDPRQASLPGTEAPAKGKGGK